MITKADYAKQATEASKLAELWRLAYVRIHQGKRAAHIEAVEVDGWYYRIELHAPLHPSGGFVVQTAIYPGQRDDISVAYLDEWTRNQTTLELRIAAERLNLARHEAIAAA